MTAHNPVTIRHADFLAPHSMTLHYKPLIVTAVALVYLAVGYYPFQWEMPVHVTPNGVAYSKTAGLQLLRPGIALTAQAPDWLATAISTSTLGVTLEVRSASAPQYGPARIFTLSEDPYVRNLTVAQDGGDLVVRLRTPKTTLNGFPPYRLRDTLSTPDWHRIDLRILPQRLKIEIDGTETLSAPLPRAALANWSRDYRLALGNELSEDRPWLGEIRLARVTVGGREIDYSHPSSLRIPRYLATVEAHHKFNPVPRKTVAIDRDFIVNLLGFIPLGMLLICLSGGSLSVMAATALCACLSLTIEVGQLFFAGRVTETADLLLNTLGAGLGAWIATRASSCTNPKLGAKKQ